MKPLLFTVWAGVAFVAAGLPSLHAQTSDDAVAEIRRLGGKVEVISDRSAPAGLKVTLQGDAIANEHLALLTKLVNVRELNLSHANIQEPDVHIRVADAVEKNGDGTPH